MRNRYLAVLIANLVTFTVAQLGSAPAQANLAVSNLPGTVGWLISSNGFVYQTGRPHGWVAVTYAASMVSPSGSIIKRGDAVSVTGTFVAGHLNATGVVVGQVTGSAYHIATMALDNSNGEGATASAASVVQLLSFARGDRKSVADCHSVFNGCKAVFYFDYSHPYQPQGNSCTYQPDVQVIAAASESWFVHQAGYSDAAHRVFGKGPPGIFNCLIWQINPNSSGAQAWFLQYLRANGGDSYDYYQVDDNAPSLRGATYFPSGGGCSPWPSLCLSTQEIANDIAEEQARANFVNAMSHSNGNPMYFFSNGAIVLDLPFTNRYVGQSCEGCVVNDVLGVVPGNYRAQLDQMAALDASPAAEVLIAKGHWPVGSPQQNLQRQVAIGITWLGYSEGHTVLMENLEANTNQLAVWPEELIYPSSPLESMTSGAVNLQVASGIYRREFATCSQKGVAFGRCAVVVNANATAVSVQSTWLQQTYGHVIAFVGGDVLSGGTLNLAGTSFVPGLTRIGAGGAILLAP